MIPGQLDIQLYKGDSYFGPLITLPSLVGFGGPSDLVGATVTAQIRAREADETPLAEFTMVVVSAAERTVRCTLPPADTASIAAKTGVWDLQIEAPDGWIGTLLRGKVEFTKEVTR